MAWTIYWALYYFLLELFGYGSLIRMALGWLRQCSYNWLGYYIILAGSIELDLVELFTYPGVRLERRIGYGLLY
jgi:hypothetical protein